MGEVEEARGSEIVEVRGSRGRGRIEARETGGRRIRSFG